MDTGPRVKAAELQDVGSTRRRLRFVIGIAVPLVVSALLVYWVARDIENPEQVWLSIREASLPLLAIVVFAGLASHFIRALRWRTIIGGRVSAFYAFSSLMIGYAVNGVIPRGGEVVRIVNMNRMTRVPVAKLVTTLVAERVLDLFTLLAMIGLSVVLVGERLAERFPTVARMSSLGLAAVAGGGLLIVLVALFPEALVRGAVKFTSRFRPSVAGRVENLIGQAAAGLSFLRSGRRFSIVLGQSVGVWLLLLGGFLVGLMAFGLLSGVGLRGGAVAFSITTASVLVPSAGAIGAYHKLGLEALVALLGADPSRSLAFVTVLHLLAYYIVPLGAGVLCWIAQFLLRRGESRI